MEREVEREGEMLRDREIDRDPERERRDGSILCAENMHDHESRLISLQ